MNFKPPLEKKKLNSSVTEVQNTAFEYETYSELSVNISYLATAAHYNFNVLRKFLI